MRGPNRLTDSTSISDCLLVTFSGMNVGWNWDKQICQNSMSNLKTVTVSMLQINNPQILGAALRSLIIRATEENWVAMATWHTGIIHPWAKEALIWDLPASFPSQSPTISSAASGTEHYVLCWIREESDSYVYMLISHKFWCRKRIKI
jgi:hypothetical protein